MHGEADRDSASWAAFFEAWWREYGDRPMTAGELMPIAENVLQEVAGKGTDRSRSTRLGLALRRKRGRIFVGRRLQQVDVTGDHSRLRTARGLVPVASEIRRGDVERLDVGEQSTIAHKTRSLPIPTSSWVLE